MAVLAGELVYCPASDDVCEVAEHQSTPLLPSRRTTCIRFCTGCNAILEEGKR